MHIEIVGDKQNIETIICNANEKPIIIIKFKKEFLDRIERLEKKVEYLEESNDYLEKQLDKLGDIVHGVDD